MRGAVAIAALSFALVGGAPAALADQAQGAFSITELRSLVEKSRPASIESLLALLPQTLRSNAVFLEKSGSIQSATPSDPRVILWSDSGKFALAFNGSPSENGYNSVETFQYDSRERRFHFLRLELQGGQFQIDEPVSCLTCHGQNPSPFWNEYPSWSGAYGGGDDFMDPLQDSRFRAFIAEAPTNPRYAAVVPAQRPREHLPFRENPSPGPDNLSTSFAYRPNLRFGAFLSRLNADRVAAAAETQMNQNPTKIRGFLASVMACTGAAPLSKTLLQAGLSANDLNLTEAGGEESEAGVLESYFDGTATQRELLAARIAGDLGSGLGADRESSGFVRTLSDKYLNVETEVTKLDRLTLLEIDSLGAWLPLPYLVTERTRTQKREPFRGTFRHRYDELCAALAR